MLRRDDLSREGVVVAHNSTPRLRPRLLHFLHLWAPRLHTPAALP